MRLLRSPAQCGDLICNLAVPIVRVSLSNLFTLSSLLLQAAAMTASSYLPATQDSIALASKAEDPFEAISILHKIPETPSSSPDALRVKEQAGLKYISGARTGCRESCRRCSFQPILKVL